MHARVARLHDARIRQLGPTPLNGGGKSACGARWSAKSFPASGEMGSFVGGGSGGDGPGRNSERFGPGTAALNRIGDRRARNGCWAACSIS